MGFWDYLSRLMGKARPAKPPTPPPTPPPPSPAKQPVTETPALQASDFLPISRDELLKGGEDVRRAANWMWFGRRDLIPPASDPRTKLIDRGMLTQGLLTAEQLAEMHTVGDLHNQYANREQQIEIQARGSAEQAVEADRAARKALKEKKKAEAAERKKLRQEAIAYRKANDICFAGKGVSALLNNRQSDADKLTAAGLPVLHTATDLATKLELTISKLRWLCFHTEVSPRIHYVQFEAPKKSGGTRTLSAPHRTLAAAQQWVLTNILEKLPVESAAHGFVAGRSTLTNARPHVARAVVVNLDLEGFFPSIGFPRVRHLFRRLGYSGAVATLLALLCTECPRKKVVYDGQTYFVATGPRNLPQGACTSPATSNQIARKLDRRLLGLAAKLGLVYTRYADDLTFSGDSGLNEKVAYLLARVRHIAAEEGFAVNAKKTRIKRPNVRQTVTGLVVNDNPGVPRDVVKRLRAILHRAKTEGLAAQNRGREPNFRAWVEGMIAYIAMSRPALGEKFRLALKDIPA
jgi:RNA-directed DNA polymerase